MGAVVNVLLAALKVVIGIVGHSQALVVDGIHSLSDLVGDALVLFAASAGSRAADDEHPYGYWRFETAATVASMAGIMGRQFAWQSLRELVDSGLRRDAGRRHRFGGWCALAP